MKNNMMRNLKKRALALVLCFAMVLNTGVTTFAEENQGTVPEVENTEYKCGFEAHEHEDTCYSKELLCEENAEPVLTCVIETHEHEAACYEEPVLKCEKTEHKHGDACYTAHVHGDGCYIVTCTESTEPVLACTTEAYAHTDSCYTAHVHGEGCYENKLTCETPESTLTCTVADCIHEDAGCYTTHSHGEGCHTSVVTCEESTEPVLACEKAEHKHGDACYTTHEHGNGCYTVTCTESTESVLVCTTEEYAHTEACYETPVLKCEKTEHVHDEEVCYVVEHVHEDKCYTEPVLICEKAVHTHTEECKKAEPVLMKSRSPKANEDFEAKIGDNKFETLKEAVDFADALGGAATVLLLKDISLGEKLTISGNVTIDGGGEFTIYRKDEDGTNDDYNGTLFEVNENASLTLAGITIDENNEWIFQKDEYEDALENFQKVSDNKAFTTGEENSPIANSYTIINNGSLNIDNTKIQNHFSRSGGLVNAGKMSVTTLKDATIIHNTYNGSGLVVRAANYDSNAVINVTGNTYIADNYVGGNHGLFMVYNGSTINMDNGLIEKNTGINANGIVVGIYGSGKNADGTIHYSTMNMSGGTIRKNSNIAGNDNGWNCTIYVYAYGPVFHMTGGVIENNTGKAYPGVLNNGGGASDLILEGGSIISNNSLAGRSGADLFSKIPLEVRRDTAVTTSRLYNNVTSVATLTGDVFFYGGEVETLSFSGANGQTGKILGDVTVMNGANMLFEEGTWEGLVTVDAVGNDTSLTVKPGAKIAGGPVRVLASVTNADSANVKEADTAQSKAYEQKSGAMVDVPVLYYHRLTSAQKNTVVITYDYNGGLDAQNWSGIQRTGEAPYTLEELPMPSKEGHELIGWKYAVDNNPESLSMDGTADYVEGTAVKESVRLIAQWAKPSYGYVVIEKNLDNYNSTMKGATFVYEVSAKKSSDPSYKFNEVVAIVMDGTSGESVKVGPILEGTEVTVTEIYSGAGYMTEKQKQKQEQILEYSKDDETLLEVVFTGRYIPGRINYGTSAMKIFRK